MIDLNDKDLAIVKKILKQTIPNTPVWAFGSRVTGGAGTFSDLDLVIVADKKIDWQQIEELRDNFSSSNLPIMVDVLDWHAIDESFQKIILHKYEVIQ